MSIQRFLPQFLLITLLFAGSACADSDEGAAAARTQEFVVIESANGEHRIDIELADDLEELMTGLMHRTELAENAGMLFDFGRTESISMWMKNTLIPLDMAFIDETGVIIRIADHTTPHSLEPIDSGGPVLAVLEVNAGAFERLGVKAGDRVRHPIFEEG